MVKQMIGMNPKTVRFLLRYTLIFFAMELFFTVPGGTVYADSKQEYTVKAAFTKNFAKYAKWPDKSFVTISSPCLLYTVGDKSVESAFQTVAGKTIGTRKLMVRFAKRPQDLAPCHMMFISRTVAPTDVLSFLQAVKGKPVLTVGETKQFVRQGGMIRFFNRNGRLYFEINMDIVRQQQIEFSSRLLKLAVLTGN